MIPNAGQTNHLDFYFAVVLKTNAGKVFFYERHWDDLNCTDLYLILEVVHTCVYVYTCVSEAAKGSLLVTQSLQSPLA